MVKSEEELEWLRNAAMMTDDVVEDMFNGLKPGMSEHEALGLLYEATARRKGSVKTQFLGFGSLDDPLVFPNQFPSSRRLRKGDVILMEISVGSGLSSGQIQRVWACGKPEREFVELHKKTCEVYQNLCDLIRDGNDCAQVRNYLNRLGPAGYNTWDVTVHGWGFAGVSAPLIDPRFPDVCLIKRTMTDMTFKEHMSVVIQPNLIKGGIGLQVGGAVEVGKNGCRSMQKLDMDFRIINPN